MEARDPDREGRVLVHIGRLRNGALCSGSLRLKLELDPVEWARFQAFVTVLKQVQAAGPEPW